MDVFDAIKIGVEKYPRRSKDAIQYGTAGFRTKAEGLDYVLYRMGLLAVLRSKSKGSAAIGLMITASHNPEADNGVKLIDPHGEMLKQSWEVHATRLANVSDSDIGVELKNIVTKELIDCEAPGKVFIGQDTRHSSPALAQAAISGIEALGGEVNDYGIVTTPMLHFFIACANTGGEYGEPTEEGYFKKLSTAFKNLRRHTPNSGNYTPNIIFDGANGVGAIKLQEGMKYLGDSLEVQIYNDGTGKLNYKCGADYVKIEQRRPNGIPNSIDARCVSVDGDGDRIVYYYTDSDHKFHLLDGDRIASLFAGYLKELLQESGLNLQLGLVQSAYANGSSTDYIVNTLKIPVSFAPTGVKYLHQKALEYDIGVYFEANGHGTVVFSDAATETIHKARINLSSSSDKKLAIEKLATVIDVINQTVGDAISDMLFVETVLHAKGWNIQDWEATYSDLPNRQLKVVIKDRRVIQTTDAERQCTSPPRLQDKINSFVKKYPKGRSFVRPSGTENIVRVYAEADTQANADDLAAQVALAVYELADGVGSPPKVPA